MFRTPQAAEEAFYNAFERGDVDAMMSVWADDDAIVCVHPMGPRLDGRSAVEESWREIFASGASLRFELTDIARSYDETLAVHCLHENIVYGDGPDERSLVIATNVYRLTDSGWRMVVHHGSPARGTKRRAPASPPKTVIH